MGRNRSLRRDNTNTSVNCSLRQRKSNKGVRTAKEKSAKPSSRTRCKLLSSEGLAGEQERKEEEKQHMSGRMSRSNYLPQADWRSSMMLSDFLDADDLSMLEEKPLVAEKNEGFKNMLRCQAVTGCLVSAGISLLCVPSTFCCERIYQGSSLVLDANKIEFSQPTPSACVLANLKRTVP